MRHTGLSSTFQSGRLYYRPFLCRQYSSFPGDDQKKDSTKPLDKEIKSEIPPLHADGHCSLEDRPISHNEQKTHEPTILDEIKNLPSEKESKRSEFSKWMVERLDKLQTTIFTAGQTLNDFTGYSSIEKLKQSIEEQGML